MYSVRWACVVKMTFGCRPQDEFGGLFQPLDSWILSAGAWVLLSMGHIVMGIAVIHGKENADTLRVATLSLVMAALAFSGGGIWASKGLRNDNIKYPLYLVLAGRWVSCALVAALSSFPLENRFVGFFAYFLNAFAHALFYTLQVWHQNVPVAVVGAVSLLATAEVMLMRDILVFTAIKDKAPQINKVLLGFTLAADAAMFYLSVKGPCPQQTSLF